MNGLLEELVDFFTPQAQLQRVQLRLKKNPTPVIAYVDAKLVKQAVLNLLINGLQAMGENLFTETAGSGSVLTGLPGSPGFGTLQQGYLETSNVNAVQEITDLITAQRAYEMNSKVISAADQMLQITSKMS